MKYSRAKTIIKIASVITALVFLWQNTAPALATRSPFEKNLLENRLICYFLHIGDYFEDYETLANFLMSHPPPRHLPPTSLNIGQEIISAFKGNNNLRTSLWSNISRANEDTQAVHDVYAILRAIEELSKDKRLMDSLRKTVTEAIGSMPMSEEKQTLLVVPCSGEAREMAENGPDPLLIWIGKKLKILPFLKKHFPSHFNRYYEPFFGSGAVFFRCRFRNSSINDRCRHLINIYRSLKDNPNEVIRHLNDYLRGYLYTESGKKSDRAYKEGFFNFVRNLPGYQPDLFYRFNDRYMGTQKSNTREAARMIFLNAACYSGLWRFSRDGYFNVPHGNREKLGIAIDPLPDTYTEGTNLCNTEKITRIHLALQDAQIYSMDYEELLRHAQAGDFIYLDPPYGDFTRYSQEDFDVLEQWRLSRVFRLLHQRGCYVMLSNYDDNTLVHKLYAGFDFQTTKTDQTIARGKGVIKEEREKRELIVRNYVNMHKVNDEIHRGI